MTAMRRTLLAVLTVVTLLGLPIAATAQPDLQDPSGQEQPLEEAVEELAVEGELGVEGDLSAGFYYQGMLTEGGSPVNATRQMEFKLYNAGSGGSQVGSTITKNVAVNGGQFNVALNWYAGQIDGKGLWLAVRAKDSGGTWRNLGRTQIRAVPYAMSLFPGAKVIKASGGNDVLFLQAKSTDYALRAIAQNASYDGVWGTGGDDGVYGDTTGTSSGNAGVVGYSNANTGAARGGYFYSKNGIGLYAQSDRLEAIYASSDNHDGVAGYSKASTRSGVYGSNQAANGYGVFGRATNVAGYGVYGQNNTATGVGAAGFTGGYSPADNTGGFWDPAGLFGGRNGVLGYSKDPSGVGVVGMCTATSGSGCRGVHGVTKSSSGWAGKFDTSAGNGVYISAPAGKRGLQVASGTKSAVVATDEGSRLLYTEESTEVWFTDYGFGTLAGGVAVVVIDPTYAKTVNLAEPYHVFVQAYGDAELYVSNRTSAQFEVHLRDGDPQVEFSYRLVAKRLGYEADRLERSPDADSDPNLYPEKAAELQALDEQNNTWFGP